MPLSHREKQRFFDSLARLIRTGITLPAALEKLGGAPIPGWECRQTAAEVFRRRPDRSEAFFRVESELGTMEVSVLGAAERTGRMDQVLHQLSDYHGSLRRHRNRLEQNCSDPAFLFHFGVFLLSLPRLLPKSELSTEPPGLDHGLGAYLRVTLGLFAAIYVIGFLLILCARALVRMAAIVLQWIGCSVDSVDRGDAPEFCSRPILPDLRAASWRRRQRSRRRCERGVGQSKRDDPAAVEEAIPAVQNGAQVGEVLAEGGALPDSLIEGLLVGEESGQLDQVLSRLAASFQSDAIAALHLVAEWMPRLIYLGVVAFFGLQKSFKPSRKCTWSVTKTDRRNCDITSHLRAQDPGIRVFMSLSGMDFVVDVIA